MPLTSMSAPARLSTLDGLRGLAAILVMLFHIVRSYLPSELKWSIVGRYFDMFALTCCMSTVVYCVFWTLRGYYADVPFVSESVYHQVQLSEYA